MTWTDLYLRAASEADLIAALPQFRGVDEDGNGIWLTASHSHALDLIGPVVTTPAVLDEDGNVTAEAVTNDAFHANLRCTPEVAAGVPESVQIVAPDTAYRAWA